MYGPSLFAQGGADTGNVLMGTHYIGHRRAKQQILSDMVVNFYRGNDFSSLHFGLCSDMISLSKRAVPQPWKQNETAAMATYVIQDAAL
jgi:hypothetical protein